MAEVRIKINTDSTPITELIKNVNTLKKDLNGVNGNDVFKNLEKETEDLSNSIDGVNTSIGKTIKTIASLEEQQRKLNEELSNTEIGTEAYRDLEKQVIRTSGELKNLELARESLDNEQFASELKSVAGGLGDMAGGLALVGASNGSIEQIVQTIAKVEGVTKAVTGGIESYSSGVKVLNALNAKGTTIQSVLAAITGTQTVATNAQTTATAGATVASNSLNVSLLANPVFLLVAGITAVVGALIYFSDETETAEEKTARLNKEQENLNRTLEQQRKTLDLITNAYIQRNVLLADISGLNRQRELLIAEDRLSDLLKNRPGDLEAIKKAQIEVNNLTIQNTKEEGAIKLKAFDDEIKQSRERLKQIDSEKFTTDVITKEGLDKRAALTTEYNEILVRLEALSQLERQKLIKENENSILKVRLDNQNKVDDINKQIREKESKDLIDSSKEFATNARKKAKLGVDTNEQMNTEIAKSTIDYTKLIAEEQEKILLQNRKESIENIKNSLSELSIVFSEFSSQTGNEFAGAFGNSLSQISNSIDVFSDESATQAEKALASFNAISSIASGFISAQTTKIQEDLEIRNTEIDDSYNQEQESLQRKLDAGLISQEQFDKQSVELEKKANAQKDVEGKKAFEQSKKLQIAQAAISGLQGAVGAYASLAPIPIVGPGLGIAAALAIAGFTANNIKKIKSTQYQSASSGGGGSSPSIGGGTPSSQQAQPQFNLFGQGNNANTIGPGAGNEPSTQAININSTVSVSEINSTQNKVKVIEERSTLG
jgi:hypothetical protein